MILHGKIITAQNTAWAFSYSNTPRSFFVLFYFGKAVFSVDVVSTWNNLRNSCLNLIFAFKDIDELMSTSSLFLF